MFCWFNISSAVDHCNNPIQNLNRVRGSSDSLPQRMKYAHYFLTSEVDCCKSVTTSKSLKTHTDRKSNCYFVH